LIGASYIVTALLLSYCLMFLLHKYETMYENFLDNSIKDTLTSVFNRSVLDEVIEIAETQYGDKDIDYALVMLDIDRFKALNDEHGHMAGDVVLQNFAECIRKSVRATDYVVRYGGDEFLLMLPGASQSNVETILRRIEMELAINPFLQTDFEVTFSRGMAHRSACENPAQLIAYADKRMYEYKQAS